MLGNGESRLKSDQRVTAYGTIDELNSFLGFAISTINDQAMKGLLQQIQQNLFNLGSILCCPSDDERPPRYPITDGDIEFLEQNIEQYNANLSPLINFILPGGSELASRLHIVRTIARRAERETILLAQIEKVAPNIIIYLNRLSDLLFILARNGNNLGKDDILWQP